MVALVEEECQVSLFPLHAVVFTAKTILAICPVIMLTVLLVYFPIILLSGFTVVFNHTISCLAVLDVEEKPLSYVLKNPNKL